jgi:hypothetical protein
MAGKGSGYAPLSYFDRLKIRAATKHLHSRYASVRHAAHKEIQRILERRRQARGRLDPKRWARQAWDRVNHGKKHECGNCEYGTRDQAMLRRHQEGHMREAARTQRAAATPGLRTDPAGARVHDQDARRQERTPPARTGARAEDAGRPWSGRAEPQPQAASARRPPPPSRLTPWPTTPGGLSRPPSGRPPRAAAPERPQRPAAPARDTRAPAAPPAAPKLAPLPHETVRVPRTPKARLRLPRLRARA